MDFEGNTSLIIKYGAYTLVYRHLLERLGAFQQTLSPQVGLAPAQAYAGVDEVLSKLLREGQPASLEEAAQRLITGLRYERDLKADRVPELAPIYDALCGAIQAGAPRWDYRQDVDRWHRLGRDLARRFYANSPHRVTQDRLTREARINFEWTRDARQAPFGYREDRLRAAKAPLAGVITVRFSFSDSQADGFANYLAYPFYFMHEYVSHIYAIPTASAMFTDGWLLRAAHRFLRHLNVHADSPLLRPEQVDAIDEILPQSGVAYRGYTLARRFQPWAEAIAPNCFEQLTYHLAALPNIDSLSHTRFLWTLERELAGARPRLRERLRTGDCRPESLLHP